MNYDEIKLTETDMVRITIAAGDWISEKDCTDYALEHADKLEARLNEVLKAINDIKQVNVNEFGYAADIKIACIIDKLKL